jgi:hypothetical protein
VRNISAAHRMPSRSPAHRDLAVCGHGVRAAVVWPRFQAPTMPSPKQTTAADGPSRPRAPDQAVILVDLQDFTPSIKRTRPKTGEPSSISGRDRPEHLVVKTVGLADLAWASLLGVPGVRILVPLYPSKRLLAGQDCRLVGPGRPAGSCLRIPVFEHLERTCAPAGRPRRKSRGRLRFERQYRD